MLNFEFDAIANGEIDFYPPELRGEIDAINDFIYTDIIRASTAAASHNHRALAALDRLDGILEHEPYLTGGRITEADWRLFTTLVRFDAVTTVTSSAT
jgi:putative glutathione S-transferase